MKRHIPVFLDIEEDRKSIISMKIFFSIILCLSILVVITSISHLLGLK